MKSAASSFRCVKPPQPTHPTDDELIVWAKSFVLSPVATPADKRHHAIVADLLAEVTR